MISRPSHVAIVTGATRASLTSGALWYRQGAEKHYAFVAGGFAEVTGDRVSILAPVAERAEDIDARRAEAAKRRAEDRLARPTADMDFERARVALIRAIARLQVSQFRRPRP